MIERILLPIALFLVAPLAAAQATFTVATFNINWGNPDLPGVVEAIRKAKADLVALQETNEESERFLRKGLAKEYPRMEFRPPEGRYLAGGFGFLSKVPMGELKWIGPKDGLFGTWICQATVSGKPIQVVNVHLAPGDFEGSKPEAALREVQRMEEVHEKEIRRIGESLAADRPVVVLGDFNGLAGSAAHRFLLDRGFVDTFAAVTKDPEAHPTWKWRVGEEDVAFRLDYVFCRGGLSASGSKVIASESSDHRPVVSVLKIGQPPKEDKK